MPDTLKRLSTDTFPRKFIYLTVFLAAVLPEYLAPVLTLASFIIFKLHFSKTNQKVKMGTLGKVFLLFMCFSFLSSFWSLTPIYSGAISLLWMGMLLGSFNISNLTSTKNHLDTLITMFSLGGGLTGAIGLLQYLFLAAKVNIPNPVWSVIDLLIYKIMPFSIANTSAVWYQSRAASTFDNPLIFATYLVLIFPIAVYGVLCGKKQDRTICAICAIFILGGIMSTSSRGAGFAVIASLVVLLFMNPKKILSVLSALIAAVLAFVLVIVKRYNILEMDLEKSTDSRLKMWEACIKLIKERPLFGYGAGCQSTSISFKGHGINKPHAHSLFFELTTELGIIGMIFFLVVFGFLIYDIIKLIKVGGAYGRLGIAVLASMIGFLVASLTEFTLQTPKELQYFMFILGLLEAAKRIANIKPAKEKPKKEKNGRNNNITNQKITAKR